MNPFRFFVLRLAFLLPPVMVAAQGGGLFANPRVGNSDLASYTSAPNSGGMPETSDEGTERLKADIMKCPEKMGSIYYAYPGGDEVRTPAPQGYKPVYISHYGRHGSRWLTSDERYKKVVQWADSVYQAGGLTPKGEDVRLRLHRVWEDAEGMGGQLTPLGARQHHDIARRMFLDYPEVFADSVRIRAVSSTVERCIMSMASFCESLKEQNPRLRISKQTGERFMRYIHHSSPEVKALESQSAAWRTDFAAFCREQIKPERFIAQLVKQPSDVTSPETVMDGLFWIAEDMQNVEPEISFFDLFTPEELFGLWRTVNYRMYVCNAASPAGGMEGPKSARPLLNDIIGKADKALAEESPCADLRFGHDTDLIRLLALMQVKDCANQESDPERYYLAWQDFNISPMGANLQLIFYRNDSGRILVKLLHNERETSLPIPSVSGVYYDWNEVKAFWK